MKKGLIFKLIVTILQIIIIPCCIVGSWETVYNNHTGDYFVDNFLDTAVIFDTDYLATVLVCVLAVAVIIMIWTPARKAAFIPAILQTIIFLVALIGVITNEDAQIKAFAFIHTGIVVLALLVCIIVAATSKKENVAE